VTDYNLGYPGVGDMIEARAADGTVIMAGVIGEKLREPQRVVAVYAETDAPVEVLRSDLHWDPRCGDNGTWFYTEA
jgi:hypothetical protein